MSKKANPAAVGGFVIGAIVLVVAGVLIFSGGRLFQKTVTVMSVFPSGVEGLAVGSPVELEGFKVGEVHAIEGLYDPKTQKIRLIVYYEVVLGSMKRVGGGVPTAEQALANARLLIDAGLRAQLQVKSFITGQAVVELGLHPGTQGELSGVGGDVVEIPTIPTTMTKVITMLANLPLDELVQKLTHAVEGFDEFIRSPDLKDTIHEAKFAVAEARKLIDDVDDEVQPLSRSAQAALDQARTSLASVQKNLDTTLGDASAAFKSADGILGQDSVTVASLDTALEELADAARAVRTLADYLEQHPDSLLKGKGGY